MGKTKTLLKEAIIEANELRSTALEQARLIIEEALTPKIQSMISSKLREEMEDGTEEQMSIEETGIDDINLEEILAEMDEAEKKDDAKETEEDDDKEVKDLTMEELEELIRSIVDEETSTEEEAPAEEIPAEETPIEGEETPPEDDDLDLDEILNELMSDDEEEEPVEEAKKDTEKEQLKEELKLALDTVNRLRQELKEQNLLNAKLLYVNRIFKEKTLNESQKLKIVKAFDKASTSKEAKLIYESINETLSSIPVKRPITESLGFASKAAGVAPKKEIITEDWVSRMQKLANIK